jgi:DNA repair protein RadA/Sms
MTAAVLETRAGLAIGQRDIYLSTVGGMRLTDPSSDLAVAVALASALTGLPLPTTAVMIGEVGLAGDLRRVSGMERRLSEAARQGFSIALIPDGDDPRREIVPNGMRALRAPTIVAALEHMIDIADHRGGAPANPRWLDARRVRPEE